MDVIKQPNMFVKLNLFVTRGLTSKHSLVLYEFLKDYKNLKKYRISIEDFRQLLGLKPKTYKVFTMLKKRVLAPAIKEINEKTDLKISYELEKIGRKTMAFWFVINQHNIQKAQEKTNTTITNKLKYYGFKDHQIKKLLEKHDENYLLINIATVEESIKK